MEKGRNQAQKTEMSLLQGHFWTFTKSKYYFEYVNTYHSDPTFLLFFFNYNRSETLFL